MLYDKDIVDFLDSKKGKRAEISDLKDYIDSLFGNVFEPNRFQKELDQLFSEGLLTCSDGIVSLRP